ncbi:hypothetical protein QJ856_gp1151 [Tupanvirus deep ocean]|uniref:Uncharacterized protein n=2 Tax=Tupanvirus TaxID=2094720 RepID=A0AC62A772_9VIRU|nr:hypothetical protein QJ856_gp1151 [Tupanvirus deep ocean]QKU33607.1 hypothetical protein [Tupanvirus deep ocean]
MVIKKIPAGTRIYLTKKNNHTLYIQPDKTLVNDNLYVAYDVRIDGETIIPKGTRVQGDWVTESTPTIAAQLQITKIFLQSSGQPITADSDVVEAISEYNNNEVNNASYLYKTMQYRATSNITRRIVNFYCKIKTLLDDRRDTIYLEIYTKEIPVTLTSDFVPYPCLQ